MQLVLAYAFNTEEWRLGRLCKHGHRWPGTEFSLRRAYVSPEGVLSSSCAGCSGAKRHPQDWLIRFIDNAASGVPEGKYLGTLCRKAHDWEKTGYSLRRKGHCVECQKEKSANTPKEVRQARARAHYLNNKEKYSQKARAQYRKEKENGRLRERLAATREKRVESKRQWRRRNGSVSRDLFRLRCFLGRVKASPSVADLVAAEERRARQQFPAYWEKVKREARKHRWKLRYLTDERLRLYTRAKSRERKARLRGGLSEHLKPSDISSHFDAFGHSCAYCGDTEADLQIEHFYPVSKGGPHCKSNIIPACSSCNYSKFNHDPFLWYKQQPFFSQERLDRICSFLNHGATKQN